MRLTARCAVFACASLLTVEALAALVKYKDWDQSPEAVYLATDDEKKAWKAVASDEEAEKFLKLFWARRDPDLKTPPNEYRLQFDALVAEGDKLFTIQGKKRGSLTERGKVLALLGAPKDIIRETGSTGGSISAVAPEAGFGASSPSAQSVILRFKYVALAANGGKDIDVRIDADRLGNERVLDSSTVKKLTEKAAAMALVNPKLTQETLPVYMTKEEFAKQQQAASDAAAEAARGPAFEAPLRAQLEKILSGEPDAKVTIFGFAYRDGATRLALQAFVPGGSATAAGSRWAILARTKDGKDAARKLEAATFGKLGNDAFADVSLALDPGQYDLAIALLDAAGGATVESKQAVTVEALPTVFAASRLLVAATDIDAPGAKAEDPFVISTRKFVTKPAGLTKTDGLSYAVRIYNPTIDPSGKLWLKRKLTVKPKGAPEMDIPSAPDEPTPAPVTKDGAVVVDIAGAVVDADLGKYFASGDYELRLTVVDGFAPAGTAPLLLKAPFRLVDGGAKK